MGPYSRDRALTGGLLAALSGLGLGLCFPKPDLGLLAWVVLLPLLWACEGCGGRRSFWLGWICGAVFYGVTIYWIPTTISTYTNLSPLVSLGPYFLLVSVLACYVGVFAAACQSARRRGWPLSLAAPILWVALEWVRGRLLGGFPWAGLGYTQYRAHHLVQMAELTGYYGLSALVVLGNSAAFELLRARDYPVAKRLRPALCFTALLICALLFGEWRLRFLGSLTPDHGITVGVVQGNIDQFHKWDPAYQQGTVDRYVRLTREARSGGAQLVIWPETAVPFYFQEEGRLRDEVLRLAADADVSILLGSPGFEYRKGGSAAAHFNRAFLIDPQAGIVGSYDKLQLVPFGEYVPLRSLLFFVDKVVEGVGSFSAGREAVVFQTSEASFGVLICYEGIYPALARRFVGGPDLIARVVQTLGWRQAVDQGGAEFLVNITNDAWFGDTAAPYQHMVMNTIRAVENRVPIVRVANTGISAIVENDGRVRWQSGLFQTVLRVETIRWAGVETFYARFGDVFAYCALAVSLLILFFPSARRGAGRGVLRRGSGGDQSGV